MLEHLSEHVTDDKGMIKAYDEHVYLGSDQPTCHVLELRRAEVYNVPSFVLVSHYDDKAELGREASGLVKVSICEQDDTDSVDVKLSDCESIGIGLFQVPYGSFEGILFVLCREV